MPDALLLTPQCSHQVSVPLDTSITAGCRMFYRADRYPAAPTLTNPTKNRNPGRAAVLCSRIRLSVHDSIVRRLVKVAAAVLVAARRRCARGERPASSPVKPPVPTVEAAVLSLAGHELSLDGGFINVTGGSVPGLRDITIERYEPASRSQFIDSCESASQMFNKPLVGRTRRAWGSRSTSPRPTQLRTRPESARSS